MFNFQDVQRELGQQHPNQWEEIWADVVSAEAHRVGIRLELVHWDWRTSAKDGGRDLVVEQGTTSTIAKLLPVRPSVWSVKSGKDGASDRTLTSELNPQTHPKLVDAVKNGSVYVYCLCHPASQDEREQLRKAADALCTAMNVGADSIKLLFDNHLIDALKLYPGVVKRHCPMMGMRTGVTLEHWGRSTPSFNTTLTYVDIANRRALIDQLASHLAAAHGPPILHVAGLSGIGKTRLVYESCRDKRTPTSVVYFESYAACMELLRSLAQDDTLRVCFVVDEVSMTEHFELCDKLHGMGDRVRAISIGPAGRRDESQDTVVVLQPPDPHTGVLAVLRENAPKTVPDESLTHIAEQSATDLRFALMMLSSLVIDPELLSDPSRLAREIGRTTSLYERVLKLFKSNKTIGDNFDDRYKWLTIGDYIGVRHPRASELEFLSKWSNHAQIELEQVVEQALECGLGERPAHLFEAVPRGMATRLFQDMLWPVIRNRFEELLASAPDEGFKRSIMRRVELCSPAVRKEVTSRFDNHFHAQLGSPSIASIKDIRSAIALKAWGELSPEAGLTWLKQAVDTASIEELQAFDGSLPGWGPTGPRRYIVWLLEGMACFSDHYSISEAILFRLATAENEDVGNNATAVWIEKHRIYLSNTQIPYPDRMDILLRRLSDATPDTIVLLMKAFVHAVTEPHTAMAPPRTIGGRLVPKEWRPVGLNVYEVFTKVVIDGLGVIARLPNDVQKLARECIAGELQTFYKEDTHSALVDFFGRPRDSDERVLLTASVQDLRDRLADDRLPAVVALAERASEWLQQVMVEDLSQRVRLVVGRSIWAYRRNSSADHEAWKEPYKAIVEELRKHPAVLSELTDWLDTPAASGGWSLGWMLATIGTCGEFDSTINSWLSERKCLNVCGGFLGTRHSVDGSIPRWATEALDAHVVADPAMAAKMTILVDRSQSGFSRVRSCVAQGGPGVHDMLGQMFGSEWDEVLGPSGQAWIIDQLWPQDGERNDVDGTTALHLFEMFRFTRKEESIPVELQPALRRIVLMPPDLGRSHNGYTWKGLALLLARTEPEAVIKCAARIALDVMTFHRGGDGDAVAVLTELAGSHDQTIVESVLETLAHLQHHIPMEIEAFQRLFATLDFATVVQAVAARGVNAARLIGQYMPDPLVASDGTPDLPPLTEWYMRTFGEDEKCFREFYVGRWNGRVVNGWAWQRTPEVDRLISAYASHPLEPFRRWASYVKKSHDADVEQDRIEFEEDKRR